MNILFLFSTPFPPSEGIGHSVYQLAKGLQKRGHRIFLMTRAKPYDPLFSREGEIEIIHVPFFPLYPFHVQAHEFWVREAMRRLPVKPDVVHAHSPLVPVPTPSLPLVTTFHTPMLQDTRQIENTGVKSFLIKIMGRTTSFWIEKKLLRYSDVIAAVSEGVKEELAEAYAVPPEKCFVLPNIPDLCFQAATSASIPGEILFLGRLAYRKGLFEIVASARKILPQFPNARYRLAGTGPLEASLKKLVRRHGLEKQFDFLGFISEREKVRDLLQRAAMVLVPSYYEGQPLALLEAMACGKAIIATREKFTAGLLENEKNALLIPSRDAAALAAATSRLLKENSFAETLGRNAKDMFAAKFDAEKILDQAEKMYSLAIKKKGKLS